jgi:aspartate aminotransferase/aminotransferase
MVQYAGVVALDVDVSDRVADYRRKRDRVLEALGGVYEITPPGGAFYAFVKAPWGTATEFVTECIRHNLLLIPGQTFSRQDSHFRLSYAVTDQTLERGLEVLRRLARGPR